MAAVDNSWMPASGRHKVNIGSSLTRALKARKGVSAPTTKRSNLPDRDFYSFRYNFKPPSIDGAKPGSIDLKRGKEATTLSVEHPSSQDGESHLFNGIENPAKELDCVLIYDEETGTFTLEKLDSYMALTYDKKITSNKPRPSASPLPPPAPPAASSSDVIDDLEALLEEGLQDGDAEGDIDEEFAELLPPSTSYRREEEEEEEEEGAIVPTPPPLKPSPPPVTLAAPPTKASAKGKGGRSRVDAGTPKSNAQPKSKGSSNRSRAAPLPPPPPPITYEEEEVFELGRSAPVPAPTAAPSHTKHQRASAPSEGLAFPGSTSSIAAPVVPTVTAVDEDSEEEDWDEVAAVPPPEPDRLEEVDGDTMFGDDIFGGPDADEEEEMEIDMNAFELQMNEHLESDEESMVEATYAEPEVKGPPISLNQFAMGASGPDAGDPSEEDYSSSDDSDED